MLVVIESLGRGEMLLVGLMVLFRLNQYLDKIQYFKVKEIKLAFEGGRCDRLMQADGELHHLENNELTVSIVGKALKVLVP